MGQNQPTILGRMASLVKVLWTVSVIIAATAIGAHAGWVGHGIVGALALGFVGLVAGCFLSRPSFLAQFLT
ncbi:hypothetical protein PWG15_09550 [Ensifer adhaerens]|uniref:hypothetical protein n=1 Tax=Ensifer adhaerens TaxID=106592 RepID=UPI0023A92A0E|nr:hypothetical protein [Ensifer adhaerens]WDZ78708.1 hypothetical protein PWG15_09550 [Ensifer adhaerens]